MDKRPSKRREETLQRFVQAIVEGDRAVGREALDEIKRNRPVQEFYQDTLIPTLDDIELELDALNAGPQERASATQALFDEVLHLQSQEQYPFSRGQQARVILMDKPRTLGAVSAKVQAMANLLLLDGWETEVMSSVASPKAVTTYILGDTPSLVLLYADTPEGLERLEEVSQAVLAETQEVSLVAMGKGTFRNKSRLKDLGLRLVVTDPATMVDHVRQFFDPDQGEKAFIRGFADNLLRLRLARNLSQNELGRKIGADRSYISKVEHGEVAPRITTVARIARALGVPVASLIP